jgi:hypothetical protein
MTITTIDSRASFGAFGLCNLGAGDDVGGEHGHPLMGEASVPRFSHLKQRDR